MTTLNELLTNAHILPHLSDCLVFGEQCFLVGGAPRDFLLGRTTNDFDFASPGDPTQLARRFARRIGGRWFMMDRTRKQSRVMLKTSEENFTYDFAPFRSDRLDDDLRLRDFTVNALAVELSRATSPGGIYDPLNARSDLRKSILRACSSEVFKDDPLRVLRGIRLASSLNMEFDENTVDLMRSAVIGLSRVSAERVRSELSLIFAIDSPTGALQRMDSLGVMPQVFGLPCHGRSFAEGIQRVDQVSQRLHTYGSALALSLNNVETNNELSAFAIIRLAAFLSGFRVLEWNSQLLKQLRFSNKSDVLIRSLAELSTSRADQLLVLDSPGRGRALWVSQLGPAPFLSLLYLLCLVDSPEPLLDRVHLAIGDYMNHQSCGRVPDLVDGSWIRSELGVSQGRFIGRYLHQLRQAEIEGRVLTLGEAHKFLKSLAQKSIDKKNDPS